VNPLALDRNITLELIDSAQNDVFIKADRQKLKQILINIINNAVKYNRVGGSIRIMNEVLSQEPPLPGMVKISISDTGKGIKAEDIHILFDPFQRIGSEISETEGTGLGLAVAKKLTEAMKGIIGVESTEGKGSTFWIELPISEARVAFHNPLPELTQSDANLTDRSGTILYVEDNYSNIELVEQILQTLRPSIRLITEMYGKNAVKCAIDYKPDLIFLDLDLPDIHGAEVLKLLQNRPETAAIPVIILSANAMRHQIDQLMKDGAKKYLTKPIDVLELVKVVDEMIVNKLPVRTT
jgi:CheY-like chemotaxis protein